MEDILSYMKKEPTAWDHYVPSLADITFTQELLENIKLWEKV